MGCLDDPVVWNGLRLDDLLHLSWMRHIGSLVILAPLAVASAHQLVPRHRSYSMNGVVSWRGNSPIVARPHVFYWLSGKDVDIANYSVDVESHLPREMVQLALHRILLRGGQHLIVDGFTYPHDIIIIEVLCLPRIWNYTLRHPSLLLLDVKWLS